MNHYITQLRTPDPHQPGEMATYFGPRVPGTSWDAAQDVLNRTGREYLTVTGQVVGEYTVDELQYD